METFKTSDEFLAWCDHYPNAWVVNVHSPDEEVLHRAECPHLRRGGDRRQGERDWDFVANPKYGFYMRERARSYRPQARPCAHCAD
jgi:hypothetical protein